MKISTLPYPEVARPPRRKVPQVLVELHGVHKGYGNGLTRNEVLSDVNLRIREGEFLAVCGFSGSGKSTLAKLIAGLIVPDQGELTMEGQTITGPGPDRGIVFQNYSLLPWLTVRGNISLSVDSVFANLSRGERSAQVGHFIELVGLTHAANRYPHELSGGMRQRVSLARSLAMKPKVLVLDEPLSALDAMTRSVMQSEILRIWEEERQTCLMITNDVDEAILMADRIVPLNPGPAASLGPIFSVDLERPRERVALNHDSQFQGLRNAITHYLVAVRDRSRAAAEDAGDVTRTLPQLTPQVFRTPSRTLFNLPI